MKILHISNSDILGGASRAAYLLHSGLRRLGYHSSMLVFNCKSNDPEIRKFLPPMDLRSRLRRRLRRKQINHSFAYYRKSRPAGSELFSTDLSEHGTDLLIQLPPCDVVNLHWIAGFVDYQSIFPQLTKHAHIVWTLHDMNPFTGGCHYNDGCSNYLNYCGFCPQLGSKKENDLYRKIFIRKKEIFDQIHPRKLHIVSPIHWLANEVRRSNLFKKFSVSVIPNSFEAEAFKPIDKIVARSALRISQDAKVVLFVADSIENRRKGFEILIKALKKFSDFPELIFISVGTGKIIVEKDLQHIHFGRIENDSLLSLIYSAADLFVIPSLQDNLPNTVLESMACGTPVAGFDVGGIPDMVRPGVTGLLAPPQDVKALQTIIMQFLKDNKKQKEMAANCRLIVMEDYALEVQTNNYIKLYETILSKNYFV